MNLSFIANENLQATLNIYRARGDTRSHRVFVLKHPYDHPITTKDTFFDAVLHTFPLNPVLSEKNRQSYNVAALIDSLHGGVRGLKEQIIDIVWPSIDHVVQQSIPTLIYGIDILSYTLFGFCDVHFDRQVYTRLLLVHGPDLPGIGTWINQSADVFCTTHGWTTAEDLSLTDYIRSADGTWGRITGLRERGDAQPMYNLTVDEAHTFFVGDGPWLVHNAGCNNDPVKGSTKYRQYQNILQDADY